MIAKRKRDSIICYRLAQERRSRSVHRCTAKGAQKCGRPFCLLHHVPWKIYYVNQILYGPHRIISIKILRICNITWYRQYGNSAHRKGGLHQCLQLSCHREIGTFSAYLIHPYFLPNREHIPPPIPFLFLTPKNMFWDEEVTNNFISACLIN